MMSFDTRNNSAVMKRAEQLRRWEESDTNREPDIPKNEKSRRIKFSSGCIFLAACVAGDKDEVVRLLKSGADINTSNVDGLTALHQACIDDNLEMVEFLVENRADINRQDNEGWTPLHATSSCGLVSIARYLVENGADLTAVNSDGELAIDLASTDAMADYLQNLIDEQGIDCQKARQMEEQLMLNDAKKWLRSDASEADRPLPKTGATALHVAAAKGYTRVLGLLLAGRANVDKQDNDGWTPLHAAAHWGQKEAAQMLVTAQSDMDVKNYAGQTAIDVADTKLVKFLEELRANNKRIKRRPSSQIKITDQIEKHIESTPRVIRVEVNDAKDSNNVLKEDSLSSLSRISESEETDSDVTDSTESSHSTSISESLDEKPKPPTEQAAPIQQDLNSPDDDTPWRRSGSVRTKLQDSPPKTQVPEKVAQTTESEVILRRAQSFENDEKFYQKYNELRARIKANSCPILPATQTTGVLIGNNPTSNYSVQKSTSLKDHRYLRKTVSPPSTPNTPATTPNNGQVRSGDNENSNDNNLVQKPIDTSEIANRNKNNAKTTDIGSIRSKISPGNIFKNFFKSFVPPVRDEESETQRKAHAKRVRETRRSTQGVTLDEIKSAEELVKKKNLNNNNNNNNNETPLTTPSSASTTSSICTTPTILATSTTTITTITSAISTLTALATPTLNSLINDRVPSTTITDDSKLNVDSNETMKSEELNSMTIAPRNDYDISKKTGVYTTSPSIITPTTTGSITTREDEPITIQRQCILTIAHNEYPERLQSDKNQMDKTTATVVNVPLNINKKTERDIDDSTRTSSINTTTTIGGIKEVSTNTEETESNDFDNSRINSTDSSLLLRKANARTATAVVEGKSNEQQHQKDITSNNMQVAHLAPEVIRIRDKRSLFDIDNANSLTLADKLRNEANKYNEASRSNTDLTSVGVTKNNINDDQEKSENDLTSRRCDSTPSSPLRQHHATAERRPSWRMKFDAGSKFKLEDVSYPASNSTIITSAPAVIAAANMSSIAQRRHNNTNNNSLQTQRPVSAPIMSSTPAATDNTNERIKDTSNDVTVTLRRNKSDEDKENDKENDSRSAQATQAVIQRRRRPKRRSTGVVHVDMDDIDPDRQDSPVDNDERESGSERTSRSRLGSTSSSTTPAGKNDPKSQTDTENGEVIDYKTLWEAEKVENEKLKDLLKKKDEEALSAKAAIERFTNAAAKNSLSEIEKRERRAMERKVSEMEEELKQLEILKADNQRLKEENGALIRVISKLSK